MVLPQQIGNAVNEQAVRGGEFVSVGIACAEWSGSTFTLTFAPPDLAKGASLRQVVSLREGGTFLCRDAFVFDTLPERAVTGGLRAENGAYLSAREDTLVLIFATERSDRTLSINVNAGESTPAERLGLFALHFQIVAGGIGFSEENILTLAATATVSRAGKRAVVYIELDLKAAILLAEGAPYAFDPDEGATGGDIAFCTVNAEREILAVTAAQSEHTEVALPGGGALMARPFGSPVLFYYDFLKSGR